MSSAVPTLSYLNASLFHMQIDELLLHVEDRRRRTLDALDPDVQAARGQYFTPHIAADLIASLPALPASGRFKILDPGAGSGSLTASLVARIMAKAPSLDVEIVAIEIDEQVAQSLRETMEELEKVARDAGVSVQTTVLVEDFIDSTSELDTDFDLVIMNPPYAKLPANSTHRGLMMQLGVQTPNIYAAFMAKGVLCLRSGGQLTAITPRSFTNGVYFEPFRKFLLDSMVIDRIHVFDSRSTVFSDTGVLQENIIINATRSCELRDVTLSISTGHHDEIVSKPVPHDDIIRPSDLRRFIRIPVGAEDDAVVKQMLDLPTSLGDLGLTVSTGRVVDFRSREMLQPEATSGFPMVYPFNVKNGEVAHPKDGGKPQWFNMVAESDTKWLVPSGNYVLIKRFSAKEERRRIVAGVWSEKSDAASHVAFDNKLNYVHQKGAGLESGLAMGLSLWLNSSPVDKYFRTFSGHTQVNATDLREMRFPTVDQLQEIGRDQAGILPEQDVIDKIVFAVLGWKGTTE